MVQAMYVLVNKVLYTVCPRKELNTDFHFVIIDLSKKDDGMLILT